MVSLTLTTHSVPTENVQHTEKDTSVNVDGNDVGSGTLFITESFVVWLNGNGQGFQLEYQGIGLHAISRDMTSYPHQHLLCHYEKKLPGHTNTPRDGGDENGIDGGDDGEEEMDEGTQDNDGGDVLTDIKFIPQNPSSLDGMFKAMSNCQLLHPDPYDDCVSDEEEFDDAEEEQEEDGEDAVHVYDSVYGDPGDGFFTGEEGFDQLSEEGRANLERFNAMLVRPAPQGQGDSDLSSRTSQMTISNGHAENGTDQFQDADEMN